MRGVERNRGLDIVDHVANIDKLGHGSPHGIALSVYMAPRAAPPRALRTITSPGGVCHMNSSRKAAQASAKWPALVGPAVHTGSYRAARSKPASALQRGGERREWRTDCARPHEPAQLLQRDRLDVGIDADSEGERERHVVEPG